MSDADSSTAIWPSDAEADAAWSLLTPELRAAFLDLPQLMLDHIGRAVPSTPEGQRREALRHYFGPLDDHGDSKAWDANGGPLAAIAAVVWPFYDQLVAQKAADARRQQVLLDMLAVAPLAVAVAAGTPPTSPDPPTSPPTKPPLDIPKDKRERTKWLTEWLVRLWQAQPPDRPNLSRQTSRDSWRVELAEAGVRQREVAAIYDKHPEMHGKRSKPNRPA